MKKVDMSSEAILERLKTVSDLRDKALKLMRTKKISWDEAAAIVDAEYFKSISKPKKNAKN